MGQFLAVLPLCQQRPIFPGRFHPSIFGTVELNFRVRNGNGWTLNVNVTDCLVHLQGFEPRDASRTHMIGMSATLATALAALQGKLVHLQGFEPGTH